MSRPPPKPDGVCRSCGALIWWATINNKPVPVDREPHGDGDIRLFQCPDGRVRGERVAKGSGPKLRQSHFKTCPDASAWSKGKERAAAKRTEGTTDARDE